MSGAGNAELTRLLRIDPTYLIVFLLLFAGFFTLINLMSATLGFQESALQRFFTVLNATSFATLVVVAILYTVQQNENTAKILLISCGVFVVSFYSYVFIKAFSRGLTIMPYPLLIELRSVKGSAYVVDLPQIIIIALLARYVYKKLRKPAAESRSLEEGVG
jgi:hypothetical protein